MFYPIRKRVKEIKQANKRKVRSDPEFLGIAGKLISLVSGRHGNIIKRSQATLLGSKFCTFLPENKTISFFNQLSPPSICNKIPPVRDVKAV